MNSPEQAPGNFRKWTDAYGQTFNTKGPFGVSRGPNLPYATLAS